jgi:hypothetical protein
MKSQNLRMRQPHIFKSFVPVLIASMTALPQQSTRNLQRYDTSKWTLVEERQARFDKSPPDEVLLLKSALPTGEGGAGQPMNDVELLVVQSGQVIYHYKERTNSDEATRFFIDDELVIHDLTGDGIPEIIFHSGSEGASDYIRLEHILRYDAPKHSFTDIAPDEFVQSGTHGLRWLTVGKRNLLVISNRGQWPATAIESHCHYCPSQFIFNVYEWKAQTSSFSLIRSLAPNALYRSGEEALNGEWTYIQKKLQQ